MKKRRERVFYTYECPITNESFTLTEKAKKPDELISVAGFYQMNPEKDDRPAIIKKELGILDQKEQ